MNATLARWNQLDVGLAAEEILPCCGSRRWALELAALRPFADEAALLTAASAVWLALPEPDWHEAFASHPRIGEKKPQAHATSRSLASSAQEQAAAMAADADAKEALRLGNQAYEAKFGRIFLICASGRSAQQILDVLQQRMHNDAATELREAAEQQRQITAIRLRKWLEEPTA
ncbi:MAG: 2-oxo-4-hydroxy-4-carboxy-5-ureidoimidazoline decarboxylase [Acidobacteriota bacterium]|nr:2-oxo-4-hydroxy-4-carboxy-5-ureidoimidazoline decarboxylase [Acidobacteriota bacterium]